MKKNQLNIYCVIPCLFNKPELLESINSILGQTLECKLICVDNGSTDDLSEELAKFGDKIIVIRNASNLGFAGGVNTGIRFALNNGAEKIALFNDDAVADKNWLKYLVESMNAQSDIGIVTCKFLKSDDKTIDSTGDMYSNWLLAFPRGRDTLDINQFEKSEYVFGASGGASIYKADMFKDIGLFDEDFFAYYEDVDISFRAQVAGWKVYYQPKAIAYHKIGMTSSRIPGFTAYHSIKNVPLIWIKNLPVKLAIKYVPLFFMTYGLTVFNTARRSGVVPVLKGLAKLLALLPRKLSERRKIQSSRKVSIDYIDGILYHDLPPDRYKLRKLRAVIIFWKNYENSN